MEEESCEALGTGVEPEGVGALDPLRDVAGKDHDEESGDGPANGHAATSEQQERQTEGDLHEPRGDDHDVGLDREPVRHLRLELVTLKREMAGAGEHQRGAERVPADIAGTIVRRRRVTGPGGGAEWSMGGVDMVRFILVDMTPIYTTTVHATGDGRNGHVSSDDGIIDLPVLMPKELGGAGGATNPEQLFAAGYAACFHSALCAWSPGRPASTPPTPPCRRPVHLGSTDTGGFGIGVELDVSLPNATPEEAQLAVDRAHEVCPYSNATRNNIDVVLSVV